MYSKSRSINSKINSAPVNFPAPESNTSLNFSSNESNYSTKTKNLNEYRTTPEDKTFYDKSDATYSPVNYESHSDSSWSDDLENQSTKLIKYEYGLVERLLYKEESFNVYNEEFDQWCENFQHLRIVGNAIKCPHPSTLIKAEYTEEVLDEHKDDKAEALITALKEAKNQVKMAVIEKILESIYSKRTMSEKKIKQQISSKSINNKSNQNSKNNSNTRQNKKNKSFLPVRKKPLVGITPVTNILSKDPIMNSHINSAKWTKNDDYYELNSLPMLYHNKIPDSGYTSRSYHLNQQSASKSKKVTFITDYNSSGSSSVISNSKAKVDLQKQLYNARFIKPASPSSSCLNLIHLPPIDIHNKATRPKSQNDKIHKSSGFSTPRNLNKFPSDFTNVSANFSPNIRSISKSSNVTIFKVLKSPNYVQYL